LRVPVGEVSLEHFYLEIREKEKTVSQEVETL
jgi:hypothetical protein